MPPRSLAPLVLTSCFAIGVGLLAQCRAVKPEPIRVGILHSLSGSMALSERPVVEATLLAIEEINAQGGLLGRPIVPVIADGKSDWPTFASEAERLISQEKVCTVFGCWTSASRKTVLPVFERHHHLLVYPVQYEGLETSPNIIYLGAAPNQQIIPATSWCFTHLKKQRFFLVGSDYIFPHTANAIIKHQLKALGGQTVDEKYLPLGSSDVRAVVQRIVASRPDMILNTINGDSNLAFFRALRRAGIGSDQIPTMSFSLAEPELRSMNGRDLAGDYATWNYFQSIDSPRNRQFVAAFRGRYGADRVTSDPMEAAYSGVHLWAQAVEDAGEAEVGAIHKAMVDQNFLGPQGIVHIDQETQHAWKSVRIGQIREDGQFDIRWTSERPVRPRPYPDYETPAQWNSFLGELHRRWGGHWANPGPQQ
jgi:urea ABC transporter urea binding protein